MSQQVPGKAVPNQPLGHLDRVQLVKWPPTNEQRQWSTFPHLMKYSTTPAELILL